MLSIILPVTLWLPFLIPTTVGQELPTDLGGFPPCAQQCISNNHGDCALLDMPCMCKNQVTEIFSCMQGSCTAEDQATTLSFAQELCEQANTTSTVKIPGASRTAATTLSTATSINTHAAGNAAGTGASSSPSVSSQPAALSTAATAGIGVGAVLGVVAVAAGGYFLWRRRKQVRISTDTAGPVVPQKEQHYTTSPAYLPKGMVHHEVDGVQWMELEAKEATR
ncbi:hypothetical protein BU23DRAFT_575773 [Bimuria novae-zelandiae CBS 107.79]|uniref:CFEM domain-containing protein n=1 Tax=Bimuria novae-zelandiae CBS 107.79 TaxID=1447943 RepID=A0A6A5UHV1_9PLEO|nr:hypothetical protein BU23DRAFT_575773 [Bimuria novae-zelandiae CBS 107.79]